MNESLSQPNDASLDQMTELFRLLSDKTRLNILLLLREGEQNVTALCERLALPQPTVSHHLGLLRMNNLIDNRRAGKQVYYGLSGRFIPDSAEGALSFRADGYRVKLDMAKGDANPPRQPS
jgi:ArsR family transcriptional regulator, zinc-responsive transcriptional repressor